MILLDDKSTGVPSTGVAVSSAEDPHVEAPFADPDRTARARIRDAAIARFGRDGIAETSLRAIAGDAGVSTPLVIHHFGSKKGLRAACDKYVADRIREQKFDAVSQGPQLDPLPALRSSPDNRPMLGYLARTIGDGSPEVSALFDDLVEDALEYTSEGIETGLIKPSRHLRERTVVLLLWSMGVLVLHEQLERLLGVDLLGEPEQFASYMLPATEILSEGVLAEGLYEQTRRAFQYREDEEDEGS